MEKNKRKFYIFGSGGHAKSCIDVIESNNLNKIVAVIFKKKRPSLVNTILSVFVVAFTNLLMRIKYMVIIRI